MEPINTRHDTQQGGGKKWVGIIFIIILIAAIAGGVYFFMNKNNADSEEANATPTSSPFEATSAPEPTEEDVDLSAYKIEVLNGTEVAGEAGKLKTALEAAGFTVDSVANADKQDYAKSIIQAKSSVSAGFISKLKEELEKDYPVGSDEELEDSDDHDVVVIIGGLEAEASDDEEASDEADTEDPTETPEPSATPAE